MEQIPVLLRVQTLNVYPFYFFLFFFALICHCLSQINPDGTILMPKEGLCWRKLLVQLAQSLLTTVFSSGCDYTEERGERRGSMMLC